MKCPKCGCVETAVVDTRPINDGNHKRRRLCPCCQDRFNTMEITEDEYEYLTDLAATLKKLMSIAMEV